MGVDVTTMYQTKSFDNMSPDELIDWTRLLAIKYFGREPVKCRHIGGGSFGIAYAVEYDDIKYVIKMYRMDGLNRTQALELKTLSEHCSAKFPKVYFIHNKDDEINIDAIGMEFIEGVPAVEVNPLNRTKAKRKALAIELATALGELHKTTNDKFGLLENPIYDTWLDFYKPYAKELYEWTMENGHDPKHKMPKAFVNLVKDAWENFDKIFDLPIEKATLIHADLVVCNFMIDPKTLKLTGIIDPFRTMWADRDYELHNLTNITGNQFFLYQTYKEMFPVSENCDVKLAFYAVFNEIYFYLLTGMSFEYIYPRMIRRLRKEMKLYFEKRHYD